MWRSLLDIGFTTISSVWKTPSTTMPKVWLPTCVTTMKPFSDSPSSVAVELEQRLEADERQQLVAQPQHRRVLDALDAMLRIAARAHQLDHGELRDGEALAGRLDQQRGDDGERERNLDDEAGAAAAHRFHVDGAADLVDVGAHDVHADAAAGDAGDLLGGREAGREDELVNLRVGQLVDLGFRSEPAGDRLGPDPLGGEAAAVVGDLDDDVAALVTGGQADRAAFGLAGGEPLGRHFQAMVGGVADHVGQRILDQIEHLAVELGIGAVHFELDRLAELGRQVAHDPRQLLPGIADRLHARLQHAFLQLGGDVREPLQRRLELGILVAAHDLDQLIAREHQLRDHGHQVLERVDVHADRLVGDLASGRSSSPPALSGLSGGGALRGRARIGRGRRRLRVGAGRLAERALELVERGLARAQRPFQRLRNERADGAPLRCRRAGGGVGRHAVELRDQVAIVARLLGLVALELVEQQLDAVDGRQDQRDGLAGDRQAVAEIAHQRFGGVGERFQPRQPEEAAGAFDGVDEAEDVIENLGVVRILLETNQLHVDDIEAFARLGQKFPQQLVHGTGTFDATCDRRLGSRGNQIGALHQRRQCVGKQFNFGCAAAIVMRR